MKKSYELEALDTGEYTPEEYVDCLKKLGEIGKTLGGDRAGLSAFKKLPFTPKSILDVGCGGGYFSALLAKEYPEAQVMGIDLSKEAITFATRHHKRENLHFEAQREKSLADIAPVDVITATLVCHHMKDDELITFLKEGKVRSHALIINDLQRGYIPYTLFKLICPRFKNRLIKEDGLLSIRRGFTRNEWRHFLKAAGFSHFSIRWKWGFRLVISAYSK